MLPALPEWMATLEWSLFPATLAGGVAAAAVAVIAGFPVLRLRGHYLAVATLGLIIILRVVINNADGVTRGALGLNGIPRHTDLWWIFGWLALCLFVCWRLKYSSVGRSLLAIRENEMAAACMGCPRPPLAAFALAPFLRRGRFMGPSSPTDPGSFSITLAFMLVVMVVVGGSGSLIGAAIAAVAITFLSEALRPVEQAVGAYGLVQIVIAVLLIAMLLLRPQGLFASAEPALLRPAPFRARRPRHPSQVEKREV